MNVQSKETATTDPLREILESLHEDGTPPRGWTVKHAADGRLDSLWEQCQDPDVLLGLLGLTPDRKLFVRAAIASFQPFFSKHPDSPLAEAVNVSQRWLQDNCEQSVLLDMCSELRRKSCRGDTDRDQVFLAHVGALFLSLVVREPFDSSRIARNLVSHIEEEFELQGESTQAVRLDMAERIRRVAKAPDIKFFAVPRQDFFHDICFPKLNLDRWFTYLTTKKENGREHEEIRELLCLGVNQTIADHCGVGTARSKLDKALRWRWEVVARADEVRAVDSQNIDFNEFEDGGVLAIDVTKTDGLLERVEEALMTALLQLAPEQRPEPRYGSVEQRLLDGLLPMPVTIKTRHGEFRVIAVDCATFVAAPDRSDLSVKVTWEEIRGDEKVLSDNIFRLSRKLSWLALHATNMGTDEVRNLVESWGENTTEKPTDCSKDLVETLCNAYVLQPLDNSVFQVCEQSLNKAFLPSNLRIQSFQRTLEIRLGEVRISREMASFGFCFQQFWLFLDGHPLSRGNTKNGELCLGWLSSDSVKLIVENRSSLTEYLQVLGERWRERLRLLAKTEIHQAKDPQIISQWLVERPIHFFPINLAEYWVMEGPPPPVPVPPLDEVGKERAARSIRAPSREDQQKVSKYFDGCSEKPIGVFRAGRYLIVLKSESEAQPFDSAGITLYPDDEAPIFVIANDPADRDHFYSIDGDVFALRRFVEWLQSALILSGLDRDVTFEYREDYGWDEPPDSPCAEQTMKLSEWLFFNIPWRGDQDFVDWRCQRDFLVFVEEQPLDDKNQSALSWRHFLREVIDERFPDR